MEQSHYTQAQTHKESQEEPNHYNCCIWFHPKGQSIHYPVIWNYVQINIMIWNRPIAKYHMPNQPQPDLSIIAVQYAVVGVYARLPHSLKLSNQISKYFSIIYM